MDPRLFTRLLIMDNALTKRRREEDFRAWHRMPDAEPLPEDPPALRSERLGIVRMLARTAALLRVFGREG